MKKVQFSFGIHNHQPVGNFDHVFQHACEHAYMPFLQVLERFPSISMAFHFSGSLIEWLETHRPDVLALLKKLVDRGNIEVLGAGFYEPILAMIPGKDQVGQIRKMSNWASEKLNYEVQGNWLTERVWEPHLALNLKHAGIDYMVVDDYHFLTSGIDPEELGGYYNTEQEGKLLGVFPISQQLRYAMPFEDPQVTIDILKAQATESGDNLLVMADDGEKFGIWPGTWETVYKQQWLEKFFTLLVENSDWLTTTTFKTYYKTHQPRGLVYLPTSSYFEMSQWTLPTRLGQQLDQLVHDLEHAGKGDLSRPFIKGGMWRNFFTKYPESNWMQKRMQSLSLNLEQLEHLQGIPEALLDDLYRSQCNCGYWHGIFGGLYLPHLRHALYEHLLKAETQFLAAGGVLPGLTDLDGDGIQEYRLRSDVLQVFVSAGTGHIREIDWLPAHFNTTNYLQRYSESYHAKLAQAEQSDALGSSIHDLVLSKEAGLQDKLFIDSYARHNLVDHIFGAGPDLQTYFQGDMASGLKLQTCEVRQSGAGVEITTRLGGPTGLVAIEKQLQLQHNTLTLQLTLGNLTDQTLRQNYGLEFNFGLLGGDSPDRYFKLNGAFAGRLNTLSEDLAVSNLALVDEWDNFTINLKLKTPAKLWRAPIETISMSEAGFERVYQASSLLPYWNLDLKPGQKFTTELVLSIDPFK